MPTVTVEVDLLWNLVGKTFDDEEFENLCFDFGIELEDIMIKSEISGNPLDTQKIYRIDIPANRYDMLCTEGIAEAIRVYLGLGALVSYSVTEGSEEIVVDEDSTKGIRPFVVCAVLRNFKFDKDRYDGFIELQDKLHNNICRKRTLVAIGTHDLDTVKGPFKYCAETPEKINFVPLNQTKSMNAKELVDFYEADRKLSKFLHIIKGFEKYPVIYDSTGQVLSLPPIINSDHSKIKLTTTNIFIECTATDLVKANVVLNTIVTMYSRYCAKPFTVEKVKVTYAQSGKVSVYPQLETRFMDASVEYINGCVGIKQTVDQLSELLLKMSLVAKPSTDHKTLKVAIPPTRSDILHQCDIMEDAAIAYNFNKIIETMPALNTIAVPLPINKLGDAIRKECAFSGYTEALAFTLCSKDENFAWLNKVDNGDEAVVLANPKTIEYQVVRTSLLPGLLKTISSNKHHALPIKLFECSDIVLRDELMERRARNQRNLCMVICDKSSQLEQIRGMVDRIFQVLGIKQGKDGYQIDDSGGNAETFFKSRRADIMYQGKKVGVFGVLHPTVLEKFEIGFPMSALEMNIEPFL